MTCPWSFFAFNYFAFSFFALSKAKNKQMQNKSKKKHIEKATLMQTDANARTIFFLLHFFAFYFSFFLPLFSTFILRLCCFDFAHLLFEVSFFSFFFPSLLIPRISRSLVIVNITLIRIAHQWLLPLRTAFGLCAGFSEAAQEGRGDLPSRDTCRIHWGEPTSHVGPLPRRGASSRQGSLGSGADFESAESAAMHSEFLPAWWQIIDLAWGTEGRFRIFMPDCCPVKPQIRGLWSAWQVRGISCWNSCWCLPFKEPCEHLLLYPVIMHLVQAGCARQQCPVPCDCMSTVDG